MQDGIVSDNSSDRILSNTIVPKILSNPGVKASTRGITILNTVEDHLIRYNSIYEGDVGVFVAENFSLSTRISNNVIESDTDGAHRAGIFMSNTWSPSPDDPITVDSNEITFTDISTA